MTQHIEYMAFGELFVEEGEDDDIFGDDEGVRYLFNAKELDEETGYYYYGARYYDARVSVWLGVDPLAEKYPGISPLAYVANNPINAVDPNGAEIIFANTESKKQFNRLYAAANATTKGRLDVLLKSNQVYNVNISRTLKDQQGNALQGGETIYNFSTNQVDINIDPTGHENDVFSMLGDELTHAHQFETGDIAYVESGGQSSVVGYDMQDEFDSKLGSMNAVDDINAKEGSNYQLSGTTKRVIDAYKSAQEGEKSKAVENFYKKDKVGKQYMKDFNEKRMGRQSDYFKEVTQLKNRGYDISRMAYRKEGKTIVE